MTENTLIALTLPIPAYQEAAKEPRTGPLAENPTAATIGLIAAPIEAIMDPNHPI
jgi:hypothetical protein